LHAQAIADIEEKESKNWRSHVKGKAMIIGEIDGSMVPIVEFKEAANEVDVTQSGAFFRSGEDN
jgi:hypothetical protein